MEYFVYGILIYLGIMSLVSVIVTLWDKHVSKIPGRRRVPEKTLLTLSALGGSVAMYITMLMIRHKTKHPKFMIGIPAIIIAQYGVFMLVRNLLR